MTRFAFAGFAVAMFSWVTVHSIMSGLQSQRVENLLDEQPHLLWESTPRALDADTKTKIDAIAREGGAKNVTYVLQTEGLLELFRPAERGRVQGAGVVMRANPAVRPGEVILGGELAAMVGINELGTQIKARSVWNLEGMPLSARVAGFVSPKNFETAKQLVNVSPTDLEALLEQHGAISRIEIQFTNPEVAGDVLQKLTTVLPDHWNTWKDLNRSLLVSLALERNMMGLAMFFLVVLASLALYLSLSVRVVERTRQSALLLALGARLSFVRNVFLCEGVVIGGIGTLVGVGTALVFCWYLKNLQLPAIYYSRSIPVLVSMGSIGVLVGLALLLAVLASFFPANQVSKIEIAEALK